MVKRYFVAYHIFNSKMKNDETLQLLQTHFNLPSNDNPPTSKIKSQWAPENKLGFLCGIVEYGQDSDIDTLYNLLSQNRFDDTLFIAEMYDYYIRPFKQHNGTGSSCHTPSDISSPKSSPKGSKKSSRANSVVDDDDYKAPQLSHTNLKKSVTARDGVCLFCWGKRNLQGAHIIAQKNIPVVLDDNHTLLMRAGLKEMHQVQNGLLLCANCHLDFDALKRYVDVVGDKLVLKVVNETNDKGDPGMSLLRFSNTLDWRRAVKVIEGSRRDNEEFIADGRNVIDKDGEMELYFLKNDQELQPNHKALEFHKTACLIWRMAGGAEEEEEYCPDDDDDQSLVNEEMGFQEKVLEYLKRSETQTTLEDNAIF